MSRRRLARTISLSGSTPAAGTDYTQTTATLPADDVLVTADQAANWDTAQCSTPDFGLLIDPNRTSEVYLGDDGNWHLPLVTGQWLVSVDEGGQQPLNAGELGLLACPRSAYRPKAEPATTVTVAPTPEPTQPATNQAPTQTNSPAIQPPVQQAPAVNNWWIWLLLLAVVWIATKDES